MRCPDCRKFVSYGELSTDDIRVDLSGTLISLTGTLTLPCAECGTELAGASVEAELEVEELFVGEVEVDEEAGETAEYELDGDPDLEGGEASDEKGGRFAKKYYTVTATGTVTRVVRDKDGNEIESKSKDCSADYSLEAREQASAFESMG